MTERELMGLQRRLAESFRDLLTVVQGMDERIRLLEERVEKLERWALEREG